MSLIPAMFQYIKKMVGANDEKQVAFAPLATPFTNDDFLFLNSEIYAKDPAKYYNEALEFSQKANSIIKKEGIWEIDSADFLYDKYIQILNGARLIASREFNQIELDQQAVARKVLYGEDNLPTAAFQTYKSYQKQYKEIIDKIQLHKTTQPGESSPEAVLWNSTFADYENELKSKEFEWKVLGQKNAIEAAIETFDEPRDNTERNEFCSQWQEAKIALSTLRSENIASGADIYPMGCIPNNLYQIGGFEWTQVNLDKNEINNLTAALKQNAGNIDIESVFGNDVLEVDSIKFEICRVILSRAWYKESLLLSRYWNYPDVLISSAEKDNFEGILPAYPVEFILVKNVNPVLSPDSEKNKMVKTHLESGLPVFAGPFMLKTSATAQSDSNQLQVQNYTRQQLSVVGKSAAESAVVHDHRTKNVGMSFIQKVQTVQGKNFSLFAQDIKLRGNIQPAVTAFKTPFGKKFTKVQVADRAGFVWVGDHWERERAIPQNTAAISGHVVDEHNAGISGAEINILGADSPVPRNYISDASGSFSSDNIKFGSYHITAKKDGFSIFETNVQLTANINIGAVALTSVKPVDSFLLLGVVYKKLPLLPNPIPGETYS
ncbi:carboxypeptidase-like regulatory domain-containing protein [Dyadobacter sp. 3J3]|uniref:carboxypeptidase-like regulatory domain-containing protein n=1 Tax=Dyadobacter sp. 3J3 TaxID=2606600 RepID=UPI001359F187|nr:carboxypeptidase-like regulatory domain-containing protein [Dyadobacter sp. 3J3]